MLLLVRPDQAYDRIKVDVLVVISLADVIELALSVNKNSEIRGDMASSLTAAEEIVITVEILERVLKQELGNIVVNSVVAHPAYADDVVIAVLVLDKSLYGFKLGRFVGRRLRRYDDWIILLYAAVLKG